MLRTLQWSAVMFGFATGAVVAALIAVAVWFVGSWLDASDITTGSVIAGVLAGLLAAGYVAGRLSRRKVFHGVLAALAFGFGVSLASLSEGSPASFASQAWFLLLSAGLGAAGAFIAARAK